MTTGQFFPQIPPTMYETLQLLKRDIFVSMNAVKIGQINSFDPAKKTAEVQILFKGMRADGTIFSNPQLVDCPVFTPQGGGAFLQLPIAAGDQCIVIFSDRNLDYWFQSGGESVPADERCHDLSDGIALVGVNALTSAMEAYDPEEAKFGYGEAVFGLKGGKLTMRNPTTDLLTLLLAFIDVLKTLSTDPGGGPLNAGSIAALEAQKAFFQGLLYT